MFKEKKAAMITYAVCLFIAAIAPILVFGKEFSQLRHDGVFMTVWIILLLVFAVLSIWGISRAEDTAVSKGKLYLPVLFAVALAIWSFAWLADYRSKTEQGIEYKYK